MSRNPLSQGLGRLILLSLVAVLSFVCVATASAAPGLNASPFVGSELGYSCESGCWVGSVSVSNVAEWRSFPPGNTSQGERHAQFSFTSTATDLAPPITGTLSEHETVETPLECFSERQFTGGDPVWTYTAAYEGPIGVVVKENFNGAAGTPAESYSIALGPISVHGTESFTDSGPSDCLNNSESVEQSSSENFNVQYMEGAATSHPFGSDPTHIAGTEVIPRSYDSNGLVGSEEETITYDLHFVNGPTITPPLLTCAEKGELGTYPACHLPTCAEKAEVGAYPSCHHETCPAGEVGTYPSCHPPTCEELGNCKLSTCPEKGEIGTYPSCHKPPVAECDTYWTKPQQKLGVPGEIGILRNDTDPTGSPLTAHVTSINFGVSEHPYSINPNTGALTFNPGRQTKPFKAIIAYDDTNAFGATSNTATVTIWVQSDPPSATQMEGCPSVGFSSTAGPSGSPMYFALGDSFSSGEGTYHYVKGTASKSGEPWDQCHRSEFAYPYLTTLQTPFDVSYFDRACSGAVIDNLYEKQEHNGKQDVNEGFQLYYLRAAEESSPETYVKDVSIGIGGNDADFSSALTACVVSWIAHSTGAKIATAALTAALDGTPGIAIEALAAYSKKHIPEHCSEGVKLPNFSLIEEQLVQVYRTINAKSVAPFATIFVMGYPKLFAEHPHGSCDINHKDTEWLDDEIGEFDNYIHGAVLTARKNYGVKAVFVDQVSAFRNHELCRKSTQEPYNQAVELGFDPHFPGYISKIVEVESFHPNVRGQAKFNEDLEECVHNASALASGYCKP